MNLPPHGRRTCVGLDMHGQKEPCDQPVEPDSPFPFCAYHLAVLLAMPRKRICAGATVYDTAMRPTRRECQNLTGSEELALCAHCRVIEKRERERARSVFDDRCPTCGRMGPGARPPRTQEGPPSQQQQMGRFPRRPAPYPPRAKSEPKPFTFGTPPYKPGDDD